MKAIVIREPGGPDVLDLLDRPKPQPGLGQIRVRVRASSLNRADLLQRKGGYPVPAGVPQDIPGMEYAGEVDTLGDGVALWSVGSRVMGLIGGGAHAEYVCVHEREAMAVPAGLSWEEAAAIPEAFITAYDALFRQLDLRSGERLLIHAVGSGVGTAAVQLAHAAGVRTFGTSRSASKLARAADLGLDAGIDTSQEGWAERLIAATGGKGVDAILDLLGGSYLSDSLRVLVLRGRLILVGLTAGRRAELDLGTILNKRIRMQGTVLRSRPLEEKISVAREFSERVLPMFESGRLHPVIERVFHFPEIREAHQLMESNSTFGKIVLTWD